MDPSSFSSGSCISLLTAQPYAFSLSVTANMSAIPCSNFHTKKNLSFIQQLWRGIHHALWKRPGSNPGPWVPSGALWPLRYTPGSNFHDLSEHCFALFTVAVVRDPRISQHLVPFRLVLDMAKSNNMSLHFWFVSMCVLAVEKQQPCRWMVLSRFSHDH